MTSTHFSRRRGLLVTAMVSTLALAVGACGGTTKEDSSSSSAPGAKNGENTADPDAPLKKGLKVAFLPKQINNPYEKIVNASGIKTVKGLDGTAKEVGPSDASASSQVPYINALAQQRQDAILISSNDPNAVCGPLKQAMQQGTKVVAYDSDTARDCRHLFINQASTPEIGKGLVENMGKQIDYKGKIAVLSATQNATNQNAWIEAMKKELKKAKYKEMKLVEVAYGDDADQKSFQKTQGLLQAHPDLKGIVSPTTVGIAAAARYLSNSSYKDKVVLSGLGTPNQMRKYVKDGTVEEFLLWNPVDLGQLAGHAATALASGRITGAEGEKFTAGKLGEYRIGKHGEVILGPPMAFNRKNIDELKF